ncbi:TMEM165/GDT1 family protein [Nocardia pseudobrasiliensis]|uniref:GDT1 family protein n=1 Tax=Nocardia pseudobrasiliensis TaxID=45979 RepID=A0A370HTI6_9NOCA|nr:TMEM165/GDT1 family protein [Nocardia pseudobrasiliensis]RDI61645.1 putative Ca2+/H+ antiporter (TMEM165/GDT1 family) [Nocardia pseudobrasiliensis]
MIATILLSFGVLFVAELGDKSQLMALTFALRYRWWVVLSGIAAASVAVNLIAVAVGHFLGAALPTDLIAVITAVILLGVGLWTLREVREPAAEADEEPAAPKSGRALFVVVSAFLLAELGDRTMFATIALASQHGWLGVWLGSVAGMVAAGGLAIAVGITVGKHIPERAIALGSGLLFLYIGAATLLSTLELGRVAEMGLAALAPIAAGLALWVRGRRAGAPTAAADRERAEIGDAR